MSNLDKKTILLVEDEAILAMNEALLLEDNGYIVLTASNGQEAVDTVSDNADIDLILMDINLGDGIDGTEAAELILLNNNIPLVFLSSHTEKDIVEKTEGITSYGYIVKNTGETVLLASMDMAFKLFEAKQEVYSVNNTLDSIFNSINDAIFLMDLDGNIISSNEAFKKFVGKTEDEVVGKKCRMILHGTDEHIEGCPFLKMKISGKREKMDMPVGDSFYEVTVDPIFNETGALDKAVHIITDVSKYKNAEKLLNTKILNLTSPQALASEVKLEDLFDLNEIKKLQDDFSEATGVASIITDIDGVPITEPSNFTRFCYDIIRGTEKGLRNCMHSDDVLGRFSTSGPTVGRCLSAGLFDAGAGITIDGKLIAKWLIGQVRDKTISEEHIINYSEEIGADSAEAVEAFNEVRVLDEIQFKKIADLLFTISKTLSTVAYQNMQQARMLNADKENEKRILHLLDEKETLLKEVHHRIKNNMASVESLLNLQIDSLDDEKSRDALQDAVLRVSSVRILYEKLLDTEQYQDLPLESFMRDVLSGIGEMFSEYTSVSIGLEIEDCNLNLKQLFPFGLIVNELVTNCFKHAFKPDDSGSIQINILKENKLLKLIVADNGKGLPHNFSEKESKSFGLILVNMLSEQLNSKFLMESNTRTKKGTVCTISMPYDNSPAL